MLNRLKVAPVVAEFLGTATLVTMALVLIETTAVSYFIATSLALTLAVIVMLFGSVSGAHVNPAVTFGMWTARRIGTLRAVSYIAAQLLGGLASWQLYQYLVDKDVPAKAVTFSTRVWLAEAVGAFILTMGITAALTKSFDALQSALVAGAAIFVGIMVASVASSGFINPAIALGLRSWGTAYALGPLVGGLVGANLYMMLFAPESRTWRAPRLYKSRR
jgi:glycerol uptake facilitator-like aquaporin